MESAPQELVDVAVIGAGTAGLAAYRTAAALTERVLMVEGGIHGTTCARVGCMPSKLLIAAGEAAHHAEHAAPFGVHATVEVDGRAVMDRVRRERDRFVGFVIEGVDRIPEDHKVHGRARFVAPGELEVDGADGKLIRRIEARSVVIATGSSPFVPPMFDAVKDRLVVNDDVFAWDSLPSSVAVFGAGVIGLELGQALSRLGVRVSMFGRSGTIGPLTDPVVRASALAAFREEMPLYPDATVHGVRRVDDGVEVTFDDLEGVRKVETFEYALVAAGRRPNLRGIGLEHAGIRLDTKGAPVFDRATLQCEGLGAEAAPVFIAGDANDDVPLLHEASDEGKIAGENAARFPTVTAGHRRSLLAITFTEPQLAIAGATFASLADESEVVVGEVSFANQGRSRVMLQNRGIGHVYADRATGRFLGAELVGPRVEHIGHLLAWAHQQGLTVDAMLAMPFYHPVVEEGLRTALRDAASKIQRR
jgi:dihydrolipoamide dehydrogenase